MLYSLLVLKYLVRNLVVYKGLEDESFGLDLVLDHRAHFVEDVSDVEHGRHQLEVVKLKPGHILLHMKPQKAYKDVLNHA